ncbi:hypothetical protein A3K80_00285 [Candidatus Bathyarchaeota archaeon RBG_13_38_9]|nr:MAG: hypothetical protein A3K80_00285 [Candidatus Bathyarchaeota archaeon RBG_13_38_9]
MNSSSQNKEKHQYQKQKKEKNRKLIILTLTKGGKTFTEIKNLTRLSKRTISHHLNQLKKEGKITQMSGMDVIRKHDLKMKRVSREAYVKRYYLETPKGEAFSKFNSYFDDYLIPKQIVDDPKDHFDKYGLIEFIPKEEKLRTEDFLRKLVDRYLFIILKYFQYREKGDIETTALWKARCLDTFPSFFSLIFISHIGGARDFFSKDGDLLGQYLSDKRQLENLTSIQSNETDSTSNIKELTNFNIIESNPTLKAEIEHRYRLRSRYLIEAIKKTISKENMHYLENYLTHAERNIEITGRRPMNLST